MRLDEWKRVAPSPACLSAEVYDVLIPILTALGADPDPECWILWGEDFVVRYSVLAPTPAGLVIAAVRLANGVESHRATAKLVRWSKLSIGEISLESSGGRRSIAVPIENLVLKGTDEQADRICDFCLGLLAAIDGRSWAPTEGFDTASRSMAAAVAPSAPARAPLRSQPALAAPRLSTGREERAELAEAARRSASRTIGKTDPVWVPPQPIGAPTAPPPAVRVAPAKDRLAVRQPEPASEAAVWDVPESTEIPAKKLPPRTWRP